jgi:hypothetical protein
MEDLFGNELTPADVTRAKKGTRTSLLVHSQMLQLYGKKENTKCKNCVHFYFRIYAKKYPKCELSGLKGSTQNHDWSSTWQACGKFELIKPSNEKSVI